MNNERYVTRLVASDTTLCIGGRNGCVREKRDNIIAEICCCTSDLCNGASEVKSYSLFIIGIASMILQRGF